MTLDRRENCKPHRPLNKLHNSPQAIVFSVLKLRHDLVWLIWSYSECKWNLEVTRFFLHKKQSVFCNILSSALSRHWSCKRNRFSHLHFLAMQNRTEANHHLMLSHYFEGLVVQVTVFSHPRRTVSCCWRCPMKHAENNARLCNSMQIAALWSRGNALGLCPRGPWFEYWPGHRLFWDFFWFSWIRPGKIWDANSIMSLPFQSSLFSVDHLSFCHPTLRNLDKEYVKRPRNAKRNSRTYLGCINYRFLAV